ncbi:type IV pilus modification protein PilV [Litoribacillus peritrichatus]|uniref:Type IV pilus modification protein PilV n=1 Tax=Litoribacillus peritrichatus TaxID=718191 RepID=A0ABP7M2G0_9GAMM
MKYARSVFFDGINQKGFSLLETLVAMVIFAVSMLGYIGMQSRGVQLNLESDQREQAIRMVEFLVNAINTNRDARGCYQTIGGEHTTQYAGTGNTENFTCLGSGVIETQAQANNDMDLWDDLLKGENQGGAMINARGCVSLDGATGDMTVTVVWQGLVATEASGSACAIDLYTGDTRRVLSFTISFADLEA